MSDTTVTSGPMIAADGMPLKESLARSLFKRKLRAFLLVTPLLLFITITFLIPIGTMLLRSIDNSIVPENLPETVVLLQDWDPQTGELPSEAVYAAMVDDLRVSVENRTNGKLGGRLNYEKSGISSLFRKMGRKIKKIKEPPYKEQLIKADKKWGDIAIWGEIKQFTGEYTDGYYLAAVDAKRGIDGNIERVSDEKQIYVKLFWRTIWLSFAITGLTILLGYPVAFLLASLPVRTSNMLMILVLLPFWTSLLVRTSSWIVLLQQQGVLNDLLVWAGIVSDENRLELMFNQTGTLIAMTQILLPFMILPLFSVMKTISPNYVRAARSLGATPWTAFWKIYFPQSIPGIGAGGILVFILAIGYYITPALVGGTAGTLISNRIAHHISSTLNWGLAAALGMIMLVMVLFAYWLYDRIVGIDNMKLG